MEWVLSHMEDPDFNTPLPGPSAQAAAEHTPGYTPDPESLVMLSSMGFTEQQARPPSACTQHPMSCRLDTFARRCWTCQSTA